MTKRAIITGASTGIGLHLAKHLAFRGYHLGLVARRYEFLENLKKEIQKECPQAIVSVLSLDVSDLDAVERELPVFIESLGGVDLFIANAGIGMSTPAWKDMTGITLKILKTNTLGAIATLEVAKKFMNAQKSGHLVGISSVAGTRGLPASSAYCSSKAALSTYLESLRLDYKGSKIKVTTVCPGFIKTPMTEKNGFMPFLLDVETAVKKIDKAIQRKKSRFVFPWQMSILTTLLKHMPGRVYDFLLGIKFKGGVFK